MALSAKGYATVIANTDENPDLQDQVIHSILAHDISALLISPCYGSAAKTFDAILDAEPLLQNASIDQWRRQLIASCRRQKQGTGVGQRRLAETC